MTRHKKVIGQSHEKSSGNEISAAFISNDVTTVLMGKGPAGGYMRWLPPEFRCEVRVGEDRYVDLAAVADKSWMSRPAILRALEAGEIVIDPFDERNLGTISYDIRLGEHYWHESAEVDFYGEPDRLHIYNPYSEASVRRAWRPARAEPKFRHAVGSRSRSQLEGIREDERIIIVDPGETILAHTEEFIGSRCDSITCNMRGRSTTGRNRIKICSDAGLGDIGYHNRWTMEITNLGKARTVLACGRRIGQMSFHRTEPVEEDYVAQGGKYQNSSDIEELKERWDLEDMLPKQWLDWEATDG